MVEGGAVYLLSDSDGLNRKVASMDGTKSFEG